MSSIILIRPGKTDYDEQRRIMGTLDIPLNAAGQQQVQLMAEELRNQGIEQVYCSPGRSAAETAELLATVWGVKMRVIKSFVNLNQGLWQGKLVDEVRIKQPKVYRLWQDHPETVHPPEGESLALGRMRVRSAVQKLLRKNRGSTFAIVLPEPIYSVVVSEVRDTDLNDLWKCECGTYEIIKHEPHSTVSMA